MKHHIFTFLLLIFCSINAYSQDSLAITNEEKSEVIVSRLTRELSLDKKQQKDLHKLLEKKWKSKSEGINAYEKKKEETLSDLQGILSEEQYALFIQLREEKMRQKEEYKRNNPKYSFSEEDKDLDF